MSSGPNLHATPCPGPPLNARVRARCGARTPPLPPPGSRRTTIAATAPTFVPVCRANTDTTDPDLVAAVRRGDDQAFELLYERYHRRIAAYIFGMVGDYGRAEDIAQDVFMSALRRMRETDRPIAFKPWVYEIAKNACIDQFRRSRRTEEVSYDADEGLGAVDYGKLVTTGPAPDVAVDQKMSIDHLRGAFGGLSETHHQILVMRELEGLSYREIGERLGMSRASVESTLFRARRRLSEEYEELSSGERCSRVQLIIAQAAGTALGARDQRKLGKHVAHCQSCRREAHLAGLDLAVLRPRPVRSRLAALLPLPAFLRRRLEGDEGGLGSGLAAGHHAPAVAQWSAQMSAAVDPAVAGWAKAAVAAATIAVAGLGAGQVGGDDRIDLRAGLPGNAVTEGLGAAPERSAVPAAATAERPAGTATGAVRPASSAAATATPAPASPSGPSAAGVAGTTADAVRETSPVAPLLGGGSTGDAPSAPAVAPADALKLPLQTGDPTATATGDGRPPSSRQEDLTQAVEDVVSALPSVPAPQTVVPTPQGATPDPRTGVADALGDATSAVTGALAP
ncbi:sigma-70 family RNA polymerase sigma factor [Paraconexibacter algicola]|uniref:sigma-70 family RNA polymerase sigma factor n=1 Tax=Paraconexibacter algicola TaxID=2133960 RepID=UPI001304AD9E|nr:sigma-70 family RNA polymerase sigma factor [Paraconexibacter algicola]